MAVAKLADVVEAFDASQRTAENVQYNLDGFDKLRKSGRRLIGGIRSVTVTLERFRESFEGKNFVLEGDPDEWERAVEWLRESARKVDEQDKYGAEKEQILLEKSREWNPGLRRALRKLVSELAPARRELVIDLRVTAQLLANMLASSTRERSPPDPWPPEDRNK